MHAATLSLAAQSNLAILGKSGLLNQSYLAGGSALALHLGHRKSYDFDFYTRTKEFRAENFAAGLKKLGRFRTTLIEPPHTLLGEFRGVKFSIFYYDYPLIKPSSSFKNVAVASIADIAAMKLSAITGRATKRDYVDLYILGRRFSLEKMFGWYQKKFGVLGNNLYTLIKALGYFEDAESDTMPKMIHHASWDQAKKFLAAESLRLARRLL